MFRQLGSDIGDLGGGNVALSSRRHAGLGG
jgi:hypothetical protein